MERIEKIYPGILIFSNYRTHQNYLYEKADPVAPLLAIHGNIL